MGWSAQEGNRSVARGTHLGSSAPADSHRMAQPIACRGLERSRRRNRSIRPLVGVIEGCWDDRVFLHADRLIDLSVERRHNWLITRRPAAWRDLRIHARLAIKEQTSIILASIVTYINMSGPFMGMVLIGEDIDSFSSRPPFVQSTPANIIGTALTGSLRGSFTGSISKNRSAEHEQPDSNDCNHLHFLHEMHFSPPKRFLAIQASVISRFQGKKQIV